jgi:uncharacterized membrane protein YbhN (UPF0104 family)
VAFSNRVHQPTKQGMYLDAVALGQVVAGTAALVGCSALALNGSRVRPLPVRHAVPAVLASTCANAVTPAGLGGSLVALRLHRRSGLTAEEASAAVLLRAAAAGIAALLVSAVAVGVLGVTPATGSGGHRLLGLLLAVPVVVALSVPRLRTRALGWLRGSLVALGAVLRRPRSAAALLLGAVGVLAGQLLTLDGAIRAAGGHVALGPVLLTLLGSSAARAAVPSPGGIGPVEAALVAGLTALGVPFAAASVAVALYRGAALGLPVVAGVVSLRWLRRRHLL